MPRIPDRIINKSAQNTQNVLGGSALVAGFFGFVAFANDSGGLGLVLLLAALALGFIASKIKTTYDYKVGTAIYK